MEPPKLSPQASRLIRSARIAHLATADASGQPHVIPICFVFDGERFYSSIDEKPKQTIELKRIRNIKNNRSVALIIDHYEENWRSIGYVLVFGTAGILTRGIAHGRAVKLLKGKYPQYKAMAIERRPLIRISPRRVRIWGHI